MRPQIIQFANLDDFLPELPVGHTVRVAALDVTEGTYEKVSNCVSLASAHTYEPLTRMATF